MSRSGQAIYSIVQSIHWTRLDLAELLLANRRDSCVIILDYSELLYRMLLGMTRSFQRC